MNKYVERLYNGIIKENPTLILMLGMCPTLAVTTSSVNGLGMGLTTMIVLAASNFMISFLRKIIPERMRIPSCMGLGFTLALTCIGLIREMLGSGTFFGIEFAPLFKDLVGTNIYSFFAHLEPVTIFVMAPGAFFVLAGLTAIQNRLKLPSATNKNKDGNCNHDCLHCRSSDEKALCDLKEEK